MDTRHDTTHGGAPRPDGTHGHGTAGMPVLDQYTRLIATPTHPIISRDKETATLLAVFEQFETSNAIILAEPGTGKTALVQHLAEVDHSHEYREVDIPLLTGDGNEDPTPRLQALFKEVRERNTSGDGRDMVLFMDEFHQLMHTSPGAIEALKPILAQSAANRLHVIAATTLEEYHKFVAPNEALAERFERVTLGPPARAAVTSTLTGIARANGLDEDDFGAGMAEQVYDAAEQYLPSQAQPRKSITILDKMIGWWRLSRSDHAPAGMEPIAMDRPLLAQCLQQLANVSLDVETDPDAVERRINEKVISQQFAAMRIKERLAIAMAGLSDPERPLASFLMVGPTSVGKTETAKVLSRTLFGDDARHLLRFDMTEYSAPTDAARFRSDISQGIWAMPYAVVLLDEIEKANPTVVRLLLQILDDGRLSDDYGRQVTFTNSYIIMTTNAGTDSHIFKDIAKWNTGADPGKEGDGKGKDGGPGDGKSDGDDDPLSDYETPIRQAIIHSQTNGTNAFSPELLARIDCIVPYQPLNESTLVTIVDNELRRFADRMRTERGITVDYHEDVVKYIALEKAPPSSDPDAGSARYAKALINDRIKSAIGLRLVEDPTINGIRLSVAGEMRVDKSDLVKGSARIKVEVTSRRQPPRQAPAKPAAKAATEARSKGPATWTRPGRTPAARGRAAPRHDRTPPRGGSTRFIS